MSRDGRTTAAVLPFANHTGDVENDGFGGTLADLVALDLAAFPKLILIERQKLDQILAELKLSESPVIEQAAAVKIGKLLGAQLMVFGSFSKMEGEKLVTARVVSVETGQILGGAVERVSVEGYQGAGRAVAIKAMTAALRPSRISEIPAVTRKPARSTTAPVYNALAVIVSASDYWNKDIPDAEFARNDAELVKEYLIDDLGLKEESVIFLDAPTKADFETVFGTAENFRGQLYRRAAAGEGKQAIFVYYSGHGAPGLRDRNSYLVPIDSNPNYIELNGYPRDLLLKNISALKAPRKTVILEACFSGGFDKGSLIKNASPLNMRLRDAPVDASVDLFTSSSADEISSWYPEKRRSLFTHIFIDELRKRALRGTPSTFGDVLKDVSRRVSSYAAQAHNREQTPQFKGDKTHSLSSR